MEFSSSLHPEIDPRKTKIEWSTALKNALGNDRLLRGFWTSDQTKDPFTDGIEFLKTGSTGEIPLQSGNLSGFGELSNTTIRKAADLSKGAAILILEGNGHFVRFSLGLAGSGKEFELARSPTGSPDEGFSIRPGAGLSAPVFLDSGTGPLSPAFASGMVAKFRLCDYTGGVRTVIGTAAFSVREPNMVMDHPWMACEMGDVRIYRTAAAIEWGTGGDSFMVGGDIMIASALVNGEANLPLQQIEIRMKPNTNVRWFNWPYKGTFSRATDTITPPPHKIELLNDQDVIIDVIEMYSTRDANNTPGSGKPVNFEGQTAEDPNSAAPQPKWTCRMSHYWESHMPKAHSLALHFNPGVTAESADEFNVKDYDADPDQWPLITDNYLQNGLHSYKVCPKWSRKLGVGPDTNILDPNFVGLSREGYMTQILGYGFEPGSPCKHTWYMSPGGSRHDRAAWPHGLVRWATDPNGVRPHGNVPWKEMMRHWMKGYFNRAEHYYTDVNLGVGIPKSRVLNGEICYNGTYYSGGNENFRPDIPNSAIDIFSYTNQQHGRSFQRDKNGNLFSSEFSRDVLHSQPNAAIGAYQFVSPRHVREALNSFTAHMLCAFDLSQNFNANDFLIRSHAWHNWQFLQMWMVGHKGPNGISVVEVEIAWARHLEQVYDKVVVDYNQGTSVTARSLKNFGMGFHLESASSLPDGTPQFYLAQNNDLNSKSYYFALVFLLMKQSGAWDRMCAYSPKCKGALELIRECLTRFAVDPFMDCDGRVDVEGVDVYYQWDGDLAKFPTSWAQLCPPKGQTTWVRNSSGGFNEYIDGIGTKHFRAQWLFVMRDFYPEYQFPRLAEAIAKVKGYYNEVEAAKKAGINYWHYRFAMMGEFKAPDYVGGPK